MRVESRDMMSQNAQWSPCWIHIQKVAWDILTWTIQHSQFITLLLQPLPPPLIIDIPHITIVSGELSACLCMTFKMAAAGVTWRDCHEGGKSSIPGSACVTEYDPSYGYALMVIHAIYKPEMAISVLQTWPDDRARFTICALYRIQELSYVQSWR